MARLEKKDVILTVPIGGRFNPALINKGIPCIGTIIGLQLGERTCT